MCQSAYVRVNDGFSEASQTGRGVRQGCSSPLLYIIYEEATENVQEGISVGDATVSLIRYADDKAVVVKQGCNV